MIKAGYPPLFSSSKNQNNQRLADTAAAFDAVATTDELVTLKAKGAARNAGGVLDATANIESRTAGRIILMFYNAGADIHDTSNRSCKLLFGIRDKQPGITFASSSLETMYDALEKPPYSIKAKYVMETKIDAAETAKLMELTASGSGVRAAKVSGRPPPPALYRTADIEAFCCEGRGTGVRAWLRRC